MSPIAEQTDRLKWSITRTVEALERQASALRRIHEQIPAEPLNLPVEEASRMLNRLGFSVVPRAVLERAIDVIEVDARSTDGDHDEAERLEGLAHKLTVCLRAF